MIMEERQRTALLEEREDHAEEETTDNMVLRTVFLPIALDRKLSDFASENNVGRGDVVRKAIEIFLKHPKA